MHPYAIKPIYISALILILLFLILLAPACSGKSQVTPTQVLITAITPNTKVSTTLQPLKYPLDTATPSIEFNDVPQTSAFFTQDFSGEFVGWKYFFQGDSEDPINSSYTLKDGKLVFDMDSVNTGLYLIYQDHSYVDIQISLSTENKGTRSSVSLVCGYSESRGWYEFNITSQGIYTLRRFDQNGMITTINQGGSQSVNVGQDINDYAITCKASQSMSLNINGKDIIEVEDFRIPVGRAGIAVWVSDRHPIKVEVDYISFKNPQ